MTVEAEHDAAPAAAPSIGEQLRQTRLRRGWSTAEAANRLHLRAVLIEALEAGDYAPFGAATYARGQLRNYAILLGLDEQVVLSGFRPAPADGHTKALRRAPELHPGRPGWCAWVGCWSWWHPRCWQPSGPVPDVSRRQRMVSPQ